MKILHIVAGIRPGSGVATVVTRLAAEQRELGHEVGVATTEVRGRKSENIEHSTFNIQHRTREGNVRVVMFRLSFPRFLYFSWGMVFGLRSLVKDADVVHVHSNWTFPVWWGGWLALREKKILAMSPHGSLDPLRLQHSRWKKKAVGWLDRGLLRRADVVHATCEAEGAWIQAVLKFESSKVLKCDEKTLNAERLTLSAQRLKPRIVVIPNGVDQCWN